MALSLAGGNGLSARLHFMFTYHATAARNRMLIVFKECLHLNFFLNRVSIENLAAKI